MGRAGIGAIGAVLALLAATAAHAQPPGGFSLVSGDPLTAFRTSTSRATSGLVSVEGPGFGRAIRVDVSQPGQTWDVELGARLGRAVARGEVAYFTFQARAIRPAPDTDEAYFTVYAQRATANYDKSLYESVAVGREWQSFTLPFT